MDGRRYASQVSRWRHQHADALPALKRRRWAQSRRSTDQPWGRALRLANCREASASSRMPVHSTIEAADCPAAEQLLLTIGRAGVLSCRAIDAVELETL